MPDTVKGIQERYAKEAKNYRREAPKVNFEFDSFSKRMISYISEIFPDRTARLKVLDIGAGTGMLSEVLLQNYPNAQVTLLDNSPEMLKQAVAYFETIGGGIKIILLRVLQTLFLDHSRMKNVI